MGKQSWEEGVGAFDIKRTAYEDLRIVRDTPGPSSPYPGLGLKHRRGTCLCQSQHSAQPAVEKSLHVSYQGCRGRGGRGSSPIPHGSIYRNSSCFSCSGYPFQGSRGAGVGSSCLQTKVHQKQTYLTNNAGTSVDPYAKNELGPLPHPTYKN